MNAAHIRFQSVSRVAARLAVVLLAGVMAVAISGYATAAVPTTHTSVVSPRAMTGGTGTGGSFVPVLTRLADTRNGTGGYTGTLVANTWQAYQITGANGVPATGVASVVLSVTALSPTAAGNIHLAPNTSRPATPLVFEEFDPGDTVSNTGIVDVGTDGMIAINPSVALNVLIDIQGYFTTGNGSPAPGGYVSAGNKRIVDTRTTGTGLPQGQLAVGSTSTISATGGSTGIPTTATAIYANITVLTTSTSYNYITPYPTGTTRPVASLTYDGSATAGTTDPTAIGTTVDLNSSGQFSLYVGPNGGAIDVLVDIQGYFDGEPSTSGFTPVSSRIYDSRVSPGVTLAANSVTSIQLGGVGGIPNGSSSLAGVALNVESLSATAVGSLRIWPGDQTEPGTSNLNYLAGDHSSSLSIVQPAISDGTIKVRNTSTGTLTLVLDAEGYFTNPLVLPPAVGTAVTGSGSRSAAHMISRSLTDRSGVQINPISGNLVYTQSLLSLAGIGQSASVMLRYNSLNDARPTLSTGLFENQLYRDGSGAITFTAADGGGYVYPLATGSGTALSYTGPNAAGTSSTLFRYQTPVGLNATLVRVGAATSGPGVEYDLTFHPSQVVNVYHDNGSNITLDYSQDTTGANKVSYTYAKGVLSSQTDTQGRTISYAYTDPNNPTQASSITDNSLGRSISLAYGGPSGALSQLTDATGAVTAFSYTSGRLSGVSTSKSGDTATHATGFTYDASHRLSTLVAGQSTAAAATWTMTYNTSTATTTPATTTNTWTDPNGHGAGYAYTTSNQVIFTTDPMGNKVSDTWTQHSDLATDMSAQKDTTTYATATSTYNLTQITAPTGTTGGMGATGRNEKFNYTTAPSGGNTMDGTYYTNADYRPNSVVDSEANMTTYTYNDWGEPTVVASYMGAAGTSHRAYQGDPKANPVPSCGGKSGQLCKATDGLGNITTYSYDSNGNVTTITPPSPLGAQTFTYDAAGRKTSETDGRNHTAYTCYDNDDRITQMSYSSTCSSTSGVTYGFDAVGNLLSRQSSATGIQVQWTYDGQNRPTMQSDSSGSTSATYDGAGNVLTFKDGGTTTYTYDAANNLLTLAEPNGSCPTGATTTVPITTPNSTGCTGFTYDTDNRRVTTNLPNGVTNTVKWDTSNRMASIVAKIGSATPSVSRSYAYLNSGSMTNSASGLLRTMVDNVANTNTVYKYDLVNRLASDAVKTGTVSDMGTAVSNDGYTYDLNGNITQQITGGATTNYGYNAADQMCWSATTTGTGCTTPTGGTSYTYDGNGNTLTGDTTTGTDTWTSYNQLASTTVGGSQSYTYNGTTNAVRVSAGSITYTNGILGQVASNSGGVAAAQYIRDPHGTLIALQTGGSSYYYTLDNIGSVLQLTDSSGTRVAAYTYNPYGKTLTATGAQAAGNPYRYASGYTDTTGLIKYGARYYNPTLGRFTQPDPSGQESNRYAYAGDNPTTNTDANGLDSNTQEIGGCLFGLCVHVGETTDSNGDSHLDVGGGVSSDAFGVDYTDTESTGDGTESGSSLGASYSVGGYTGGVDEDENGDSGDAGVDIGTGDGEPSVDADYNYEF